MSLEHYIVIGVASVVVVVGLIILIKFLLRKKANDEVLYWHYQDQWLVNAFDNNDCAVYGFRGSGKDCLFAHTINLKGEKHYSNIWYNDLTEVRDIKDLHCGGNEYPNFINGNIKPFTPNFEDGYHFFISDAGVYLGCQYNKELNAEFGKLPIHLALRRHLYNSHVHTNSQALNRVWDKLREQQGAFIHCLGTKNYGDYLVVSAISYTNYESALACLPPPKKVDKFSTMKYGEIKEHRFKIPVASLEYNTRHFKTILHTNKEEKLQYERAKLIV